MPCAVASSDFIDPSCRSHIALSAPAQTEFMQLPGAERWPLLKIFALSPHQIISSTAVGHSPEYNCHAVTRPDRQLTGHVAGRQFRFLDCRNDVRVSAQALNRPLATCRRPCGPVRVTEICGISTRFGDEAIMLYKPFLVGLLLIRVTSRQAISAFTLRAGLRSTPNSPARVECTVTDHRTRPQP